jgi:hypothetical protein
MTIEVTDEMIAAARDASIALTNHCSTYLETKASLEAVFAIVERDHEIGPKICGAFEYPGEEDFAYRKCTLSPHHGGRHGRYIENDGWSSWA